MLYYFEKYHSISNFDDLDQFKQNALHIACASGYSDLIHFLIKRGDINYYLQDFNGNTCLHMGWFKTDKDKTTFIIFISCKMWASKDMLDLDQTEQWKMRQTYRNYEQSKSNAI